MGLLREDIEKAWVADLRNPDNKQGTGVLKNEYGEYCCLGRLCEVLIDKFGFDIRVREEKNDDGSVAWYDYEYKGTSSYEVLPKALAEELGISTNPIVNVGFDDEAGDYEGEIHLTDANDSGDSFEDIAGYIERGEFV